MRPRFYAKKVEAASEKHAKRRETRLLDPVQNGGVQPATGRKAAAKVRRERGTMSKDKAHGANAGMSEREGKVLDHPWRAKRRK